MNDLVIFIFILWLFLLVVTSWFIVNLLRPA